MTDVDFNKINELENPDVGLLVLDKSNVNNYCTVAKDWLPVIKKLHKNTFVLDYFKLYTNIGKKGLEKYVYEYIGDRKIAIIYFPDMFSSEFDLTFLDKLRENNFVFCYFTDIDEYFYSSQRYLAQVMDIVLVDDYYEKFRFKKWGIESLFFPSSFVSKEYTNLELENKDIDISFVGRLDRRGRKEQLGFLRNNNIKVDCFGVGSKNGLVTKTEMIKVFNRSKINLNFTGVSEIGNKNIDNRLRQIKGRCQEISLTKSFVLSEYAPGIERIFDIGSEIDVFYNKHDLLEKLSFYLSNDKKREELAQKAYARALRDYDSMKVCQKLLKLIFYKAKNKKYLKTRIFIDNSFTKFNNASRAVYLLAFIKQRKWILMKEELWQMIRAAKFNVFEAFLVIAKQVLRDLFRVYPFLRKIQACILMGQRVNLL